MSMDVREQFQSLAKAIAMGDLANAAMDLDAIAGHLGWSDEDGELDGLSEYVWRGRSEAQVIQRREARRLAAQPRLLTPMQQAAL